MNILNNIIEKKRNDKYKIIIDNTKNIVVDLS